MKLSITGKHMEVRGGMKRYIENRLDKLVTFFAGISEAHAVLKIEKYLSTAEVSLSGKKLHLFAEGSSDENLYVAIDRAIDRLEEQVRRQREKVKEHHHKELVKIKKGEIRET